MLERHFINDIQRLWEKEVRTSFSGVVFWKKDIFSVRKNMARETVSSVGSMFETLRILHV